MPYFFLTLLTILLLSLQMVLARWLGLGTPHLLLAVLLPFCFTKPKELTFFFAVLSGLALDLAPGSLVGLNLLLHSLCALGATVLQRSYFNQPSTLLALLVFGLICLAYELVLAAIFTGMSWLILLPVVTTTICAILIYWLMSQFSSQQEILPHA